jgi:NitT/TauT family transport system substrate-binding protein
MGMMGRTLLAAATLIAATLTAAHAEVDQVRIARQPSLGHLPLMIMEDRKLLEKNAAARGVPDLKASYATLAGGAAMNDALLSGAIQFAAGGVPPLVLLWSKTAGSGNAVKAVTAMNSMPLLLNTTNPDVKSLKDFTPRDKIVLPAVKVSIQAMFLQMAAEKELGEDRRNELDKLTVTLSHPDGMAALLSRNEVTAHFTAAPIQELELKQPGVRTVLNSFDVMGGPCTFNVIWATSQFVAQNPKVYEAFAASVEEAVEIINADKKAAAATYVRLAKDSSDLALIEQILNDPQVTFTTTPQNIQKFVDFMVRTKAIGRGADSWKALFFENAHAKQGS